MKIYNKPRQSGKTTHLIDQVEWVSIFSYETPNIWIVVPSTAMRVYIERKLKEKQLSGVNVEYCTYMGHTLGSIPTYIFVDEYQHCNEHLIEFIKETYPDRTVMWGTPEATPTRKILYGK